ncbi:FIST signal transduction protein [Flagellimonas allohymeniacidonis]|uniref:Histidine kinase n=1 Tax=Flagellimonas allohymeniacidonis TaxID=2517819 RepID=A0A4Q8QA51_9FLAO|nr:FIST N-terminal domain-containing protein [Allomuricauda hymeniacidonis]TAI47165.1 histidine kinase [Allomuricauda hymeniacidonis]
MKIVQAKRIGNENWEFQQEETLKEPLVLVFGDRYLLEDNKLFGEIQEMYPDGHLVFGSTSGEIMDTNVYDGSITLTAIEFEKTRFKIENKNVSDYASIEEMGEAISKSFDKENLDHLFVVSDGSFVNGSGLIQGLESDSSFQASITGGLCGDGARFEKTLASYNENPKQGEVIAIGFYGDELEVSYANYGGWTAFGPVRTITKSKNNVLFEIDGKPALDLYKKYLGERAEELPQAALLYPLTVQQHDKKEPLVRTILTIDEENSSMILAGDVPVDSKVQLMMSTVDDIAEGASKAAELAMRGRKNKPELAILISCVGRKLVLDQRTEDEIEEVADIIGDQAAITGFYSYGEMAPFAGKNECQLHNQTMTLTLLSE